MNEWNCRSFTSGIDSEVLKCAQDKVKQICDQEHDYKSRWETYAKQYSNLGGNAPYHKLLPGFESGKKVYNFTIQDRTLNFPTNCINCGATLHGSICDYCKTEYCR